MASPVLAYAGVERIVVVSRIDPADTGALTATAISEQARGIIADGLAQARRPVPVTVALAGDAAVIDPTALVVLIHANAAADPASTAAGGAGNRGIASLTCPGRRTATATAASPERAGSAAGLQRALRALIVPTVVEPLMSMPEAR